jgi:hypothetical protein
MPQDNIIDTSKPSAGRMYDYYLGGNHNFEVDRQAADQALKIMPSIAKSARLQRWALQDIAVELSRERDYDVIIDFASGLPTQDHIHHKVKKGTTVIYSDDDPIVVEYAHDILKDTSDVYFFRADARRPEELLERPEVVKIFKGRRRVAFVCWGVAAFIPEDKDLTHMAQYLYDWSAPDSCLAFNAQGVDSNLEDPAMVKLTKIYGNTKQLTATRTLEKFQELVLPWHADKMGFIPLLEWHGLSRSELSEEDIAGFEARGSGYGAYLVK